MFAQSLGFQKVVCDVDSSEVVHLVSASSPPLHVYADLIGDI